jgi:hypothetical protein
VTNAQYALADTQNLLRDEASGFFFYITCKTARSSVESGPALAFPSFRACIFHYFMNIASLISPEEDLFSAYLSKIDIFLF